MNDNHFIRSLPLAADRPWIGISIALIAVLLAFALRLMLDNVLPPGFPYLTIFPTIVLVSFLFGVSAGVVAGVVGGLLCWYFLLSPLNSWTLDRGGMIALAFYVLVVTVDIALIGIMTAANRRLDEQGARLRLLADNRELLFRELQHRVSNNLQVVGSLLLLQRRTIADEQARAALTEASNRLTLVGRISRQLYEIDGMQASLAGFLRQIADEILEASGRGDIEVHFDVDDTISLSPEAAIPTALIFTEIVSNALEHGFADMRTGSITVTLRRRTGGGVDLVVEDDGHGLPPSFAIDQSSSMGLKIAQLLAQQLKGGFVLEPGTGTRARLWLGAG